jgi:two-component system sensor histidine kinase NblS
MATPPSISPNPSPDAPKKSGFFKPKLAFFSSENQILLMIILVISVAFLIVAFAIYGKYQDYLDQLYNGFEDLVVKTTATMTAEQMEAGSEPNLKVRSFLDGMVKNSKDIAALVIEDPQGKRVYETRNAMVLDAISGNNKHEIHVPLRKFNASSDSPDLGIVYITLSGKTKEDITQYTRTLVIWVFISAWFISILAVSLNTYFLSKHLRTLIRGVQRLSTGDFGYKISDSDLWGELKHLAESFNDMSVRLRAYEDQNLDTITYERNKLEAVLLSIADGVVVCDISGETIIINDSACDVLGIKTNRPLLGRSIKEYVTVDGTQCFVPLLQEFEELCKKYQNRLPEVFSRHVEMPNISLKVIVSPIQDTEGENLGYVMILHDVTKEMEVDKLKTNFISNVSHELRTPVTTIKSYVDTLYNHGEELDKETYDEFIETINVETDRLKKLVNDILDFSRLEEGYKLEKEWQDITPVINLTVQSVKVLAQQKSLNLTTAIESSLPKVYINADSIERVLRNLLSNAIKYTPDNGRIKVRAEMSQEGDAVEVTVQDTGIGIPEEHLPHIFDRFYRVENKVHTVKGTGLGLHLVKVTVEEHHAGQVFVKSDPGSGSTFGFRIPLMVKDDLEVDPKKPELEEV